MTLSGVSVILFTTLLGQASPPAASTERGPSPLPISVTDPTYARALEIYSRGAIKAPTEITSDPSHSRARTLYAGAYPQDRSMRPATAAPSRVSSRAPATQPHAPDASAMQENLPSAPTATCEPCQRTEWSPPLHRGKRHHHRYR